MTTREVLKRLPGLSRDTLYYWERRGWVSSIGPGEEPRVGREESVGAIPYDAVRPRSRRHYTEEEFRKIALIWEYYQEGLRPEKAYERAVADLKKGKSR